MIETHYYIACDLGAESGRVILGCLADGRVTMEEIHRFGNRPIRIGNSLRWNILGIFEELKVGLRKVGLMGKRIESLSATSWGLDYVLSGAGQPMLSLPYHYRDERTELSYAAAMLSPGAEVIFGETGLQFMRFNTLYQLIAEREKSPGLVDLADHFLMIADYLHFLLSGVAVSEESIASTTQMYDGRQGNWSERLQEVFSLPKKIFPRIVSGGTSLGCLLPEVAEELGLENVQVVATCSHDTGAAVAAVPGIGDDWAYLSSGTWSLIGVELPGPILSADAKEYNFTNERGFGGTTRFLKNLVGLWILQECRREWELMGTRYEYEYLSEAAEESEPFRSLIHPNDLRFWKPDEMLEKIRSYCLETRQAVPVTPGQFARCIYESLALLYAKTISEIALVTGRKCQRLHIVGGGSQSRFLNQATASATGCVVYAGPVEATAVGNILLQAVSLGHLESLEALRGVVRESFEIDVYQPESSVGWKAATERFGDLPG